ncbi:MAG: c-type cytochrome biogenesis protein CcsB [Lachnospiraceae bacterium]|nr:c-type cytochrome biogenesis protein CcsB [Lachnospiraceae bacterium]
MLNNVFFASIVCFFVTAVVQIGGTVFKKEKIAKTSWILTCVSTVVLTVYLVWRGVEAGRLPLANQFEFATAFAWGIAVMTIILHLKMQIDWLGAISMPAIFLMLSYAALLPRDITELMPALKSAWFGLHISSAVFSYAGFAIACFAGMRYLTNIGKGVREDDVAMKKLDYLMYRMIAFGFILLTVVILSGCIWAEQAWSAFWSWDPKETWALISWIIYAIYLHLRINKKHSGRKMAIVAVVSMICVIFTFIGVNQLLPGLHSYK